MELQGLQGYGLCKTGQPELLLKRKTGAAFFDVEKDSSLIRHDETKRRTVLGLQTTLRLALSGSETFGDGSWNKVICLTTITITQKNLNCNTQVHCFC